jgi:hypothetical protein
MAANTPKPLTATNRKVLLDLQEQTLPFSLAATVRSTDDDG